MTLKPDVVIVGGGIAGVATAYYLSLEGMKVTVVEKDGIAMHASGYAYGGIGHLGKTGSPGINDPVARLSSQLHAGLKSTLALNTGIDIEYRTKPVITLAFDDTEYELIKKHMTWTRDVLGIPAEAVTTSKATELEPRINPDVVGAVISEGNTNLNPQRLTLAMAQVAEAKGTEFVYDCVTGLTKDRTNITGITLANGSISAGRTVLAMGPWTSNTENWLATKIPIIPLKGQILRLRAHGNPVPASISWGSEYATSKADGLLWTGSTEEEVGFDELPTEPARRQIFQSVKTMLPYTKSATVAMQTACMRPVTPDGALVLGPVPRWENIYLATGGARQGIMLGPGIGRVTADLLIHGTTPVDIEPLSIKRFDGYTAVQV